MTLYRQYRPTRFQDLIGQTAISHTLQQALLKERIAHAYLFSGPRGTGKTTTARIFARALNCLTPVQKEDSFEPCNHCEACLSMLEGRTADLAEIDAASNRGIEDIRELREQTQYGPMQLNRKIYIIDEVHMLTGEAFNALLKTLEEPPAHTVFILATTELNKVPATIRSRCQSLRFKAASVEAITKKLDQIIKAEKWTVESGVPTLIAEHADGAFRDAETILEQLATSHQPLTKALTIDSLGIVENDLLEQIFSLIAVGNSTALLALFQESLASSQLRAEALNRALIERFRQALYTPDKAERMSKERIIFGMEQLLEAYILQRSAPSPLLPIEIACLKITEYHSQTGAAVSHTRIIAEPAKVQPSASNSTKAPVVAVKTQPVAPASSVPVVELHDAPIKDIRRAWKQGCEEIARTNLPLGQMLRDTAFHSNTETDITIHVRYKFHVEKLSEKKNRHQVEKLLQELTGSSWNIHYLLSDTLPKRKPSDSLGPGKLSSEEAAAVFGQDK